MVKAVGIDLGTTNSVLAVLVRGEPVVIASAEGARTTPSVVAFKGKERLVGHVAKRQSTLTPDKTLYSAKRFIGRKYPEVTEEIGMVPYNVVPGPNEAVRFEIDSKLYSPEEISAIVLSKLADDASSYLGEKIHNVVITVPAYFNYSQRQATKDAALIAGLNVLRIINEPTSAALAYSLNKNTNETILIIDLGGGTLDVSILDLGNGVLEVRSTSGDTHLGGDNFDKEVADWLAAQFMREHGIDLRNDKQALQRLREAAGKAKIELSTVLETQIILPFIIDGIEAKHLEVELKRTKFNELIHHLLERCRATIEAALADAKITADDVDQVILVGGSTRIPAVQQIVQEVIRGRKTSRSLNPDEAMAMGAAIQAGMLTGELKEKVILDVTPYSLSLETMGEIMAKVVERNTTIPTRSIQLFSCANHSLPTTDLHLLQGEGDAFVSPRLGQLKLDSLPVAKDAAQLELTFNIDASGILSISAKDMANDMEQTVTISCSPNLDKAEIERLTEDAKRYWAEKEKLREES